MTEVDFAGWLWMVDDGDVLRGARWNDGDVQTVAHLLDGAALHAIYTAGYLGWLLVANGEVYFDDAPGQDERATALMIMVPELVGKQQSPEDARALATRYFLKIKAQASQSGLVPVPLAPPKTE